jgi:hypothetical protein
MRAVVGVSDIPLFQGVEALGRQTSRHRYDSRTQVDSTFEGCYSPNAIAARTPQQRRLNGLRVNACDASASNRFR